MEKKHYTAPVLTLLGDVEKVTKGQQNQGRDDQHRRFNYGGGGRNDPTSGRRR